MRYMSPVTAVLFPLFIVFKFRIDFLGRLCRPYIIVEGGRPLLTQQSIDVSVFFKI